jgi:Ser/Thr protein kinase RdoA (MazF antagonist)
MSEIPPGHLNLIDRLLERHGLARRGAAPVAGSVLNDNYRVETTAGPRFVRLHATRRDGERVRREHRAATWAAAHGLPAAAPIADASGETLHRIGGVFVSLWPWVEGRTVARAAISDGEAAALGWLLGDLQRELAGYADPTLEDGKVGTAWSTEEAISTLWRVDDLIRYNPSPSEENQRVLEAIRFQLGLLEGGAARPAADFADLPRQPCHGDFHERNVLFGPSDTIAAVVDWEMVCLLPPLYELLRAVTFLGLLDASALLRTFLGAYRAHTIVAPDATTAAAVVEMRWQAMLNGTWVYRAAFIEGNDRASRFLIEEAAELRRWSDGAFRAWLAALLGGES